MTTKKIIIFVVALGILAAFVAIGFRTSAPKAEVPPEQLEIGEWPSEEVQKMDVTEHSEHYSITASYPKVVSDSITVSMKGFIEKQIEQFKEDTSWVNDTESASSDSLTLDINYTSAKSATVQTYIFTINSYTGGAHGMQVRQTFAYNRGGQLLSLSSLFSDSANGLPTLATLVQKELMKRDNADADWIKDGASPKEENYRSFVVTDTGVTILFDPYQVAPYSEGSIDVTVPVSGFAKVANAEIFRP